MRIFHPSNPGSSADLSHTCGYEGIGRYCRIRVMRNDPDKVYAWLRSVYAFDHLFALQTSNGDEPRDWFVKGLRLVQTFP
jgi:hypothetical protein